MTEGIHMPDSAPCYTSFASRRRRVTIIHSDRHHSIVPQARCPQLALVSGTFGLFPHGPGPLGTKMVHSPRLPYPTIHSYWQSHFSAASRGENLQISLSEPGRRGSYKASWAPQATGARTRRLPSRATLGCHKTLSFPAGSGEIETPRRGGHGGFLGYRP